MPCEHGHAHMDLLLRCCSGVFNFAYRSIKIAVLHRALTAQAHCVCLWVTDAFVKRCKVENFDAESIKIAGPLYIRNTASDRCCIILTGHVKIIAGEEGFESECGAWTILGLSATKQSVYIPDFTAKVIGPDMVRIMYISNTEFRNFSQGKRVPRRSFDQSFGIDSKPGPLGTKPSRRRRRQGNARQSQAGMSSPTGRTSPTSISHSEEDEDEDEADQRDSVPDDVRPSITRLETVAASPRLDPAPMSASSGNDRDTTPTTASGSVSPGRSPPTMSLPSPRMTEPPIFRLHSVEKDPYREHDSMNGEGAMDDSRSANAPGSGQKLASPSKGQRGL